MDYRNMFSELWDFAISVIEFVQKLWEWLFNPVHIGFNIDKVDNAFWGFFVNWFIDFLNKVNVTFTPFYTFAGGTILVLLVLYLVKTFIPVA